MHASNAQTKHGVQRGVHSMHQSITVQLFHANCYIQCSPKGDAQPTKINLCHQQKRELQAYLQPTLAGDRGRACPGRPAPSQRRRGALMPLPESSAHSAHALSACSPVWVPCALPVQTYRGRFVQALAVVYQHANGLWSKRPPATPTAALYS